VRAREADSVRQDEEPLTAGLLILDREADEVLRRLARLPVHGEERHAVAAMDLQGEERCRVLPDDLELARHRSLPPRRCCGASSSARRPVADPERGRAPAAPSPSQDPLIATRPHAPAAAAPPPPPPRPPPAPPPCPHPA